ncbi:hypothetical protein GCM10020256_72410 [Streptomyces thermocoprophilus]
MVSRPRNAGPAGVQPFQRFVELSARVLRRHGPDPTRPARDGIGPRADRTACAGPGPAGRVARYVYASGSKAMPDGFAEARWEVKLPSFRPKWALPKS